MKLKNIKNVLISLILSFSLIFQYSLSSSYAILNTNEDSSNNTSNEELQTPPLDSIDNIDSHLQDINSSESNNAPSEPNQSSTDTTIVDTSKLDPGLLSAIKDALAPNDLTEENLNSLTYLDASGKNISDINGLELIPNLTSLILDNNNLSDISQIPKSLLSLQNLSINNNSITDISSLSSINSVSALNQKININREIIQGDEVKIKIGDDIYSPINIDGSQCSEESISATDKDGTNVYLKDSQFIFPSPKENLSYAVTFNCSDKFQVNYLINVFVKPIDNNNPNDDNNNDTDSSSTDNPNDSDNNDDSSDNIYIESNNNNIHFITQNNVIVQNVNIVTKFKNFVNNKTPLSKFSKVQINASNKNLHVGDPFDPLKGVTAIDESGSDLTKYILIAKNTVIANDKGIVTTPGNYEVIYEVRDTSGFITSKTIQVNVYAYGESLPIDNVKTGDNSTIFILSFVAIIAIVGLIIVNKSIKKKNNK